MPDVFSLYPQAPQPANPLQTMSNTMGLVGQMNQNRLFQQEFASRAALGPILQQSLARNPLTGEMQLDESRALEGMVQNPATAWRAQEFLQQMMARKAQEIDNAKAQTETAIMQAGQIRTSLGAALNDPSKWNVKSLHKLLDHLSLPVDKGGLGVIDRGQALGYQQEVSEAGDNPVAIVKLLERHLLENSSAEQQARLLYGQLVQLDTGQGIQLGYESPMRGGVSPAGFVQRQLSPSERADVAIRGQAPVTRTVMNAEGQPEEVTVPVGELAGTNQLLGGFPAPGAPGNPLIGPQETSGAPPQSSSVDLLRGATSVPVGAVEATKSAEEKVGAASGDQIAALYAETENIPTQLFNLDKAIELAGKLPEDQLGVGSEYFAELKSFVNTVNPTKYKFDEKDMSDLVARQELSKLLTRIVTDQLGGMGGGTDAKLAAATSANANTSMQKATIDEVLKINVGLLKMRQAMAEAWSREGAPSREYNKWKTQWNKNIDPRAFMWDVLDDHKKTVLLDTLDKKPKEKEKFLGTMELIRGLGS